MYIDIAIAVVLILCAVAGAGIWLERASARRRRAMHALRQEERVSKARRMRGDPP